MFVSKGNQILKDMERKHQIAIIGGGAAGVTFVHYLINNIIAHRLCQITDITIFEHKEMGAGIAYQDDFDHLILNVRAQSMGIEKSSLGNFSQWCENKIKNDILAASVIKDKNYPPRHLFGLYLKELFQETIRIANQHNIKLKHIKEEIIDLDKNNKFKLTTSTNKVNYFDLVILCIGNNQPADNYRLIGVPGYIHNPYPMNNNLKNISHKDKVAILGSSLTAIDAAIVLLTKGHQGEIHMHSRNGTLPSVRGLITNHEMRFLKKETLERKADTNKQKIKLKEILKLFRKELAFVNENWKNVLLPSLYSVNDFINQEIESATEINKWQSVLIATNDIVEDYWHLIDDKDKELFLKKYHSIWMARRSPIPYINAKKLQSAINNGQLIIEKGIQKIEVIDGKFSITSQAEKKEIYQWVINAIGPARDINPATDSLLLNNMLRKGYVKKHPHGGLAIDFKEASIIDQQGNMDKAFRAIGHITSGTYYYTSSYIMIAKKAKYVAEKLTALIEGRIANEV